MFYQYPSIGDENIFQQFCVDVYNETYDTTDFQNYKTKGAPQYGIDAYSIKFKIVIQSKKKKLTRSDKEIEKELLNDLTETIELLKNLPFNFDQLIFASNTKRYSAVEDMAAKLSQSLTYTVKFVSWEDFEYKITKFPKLRKTYFPDFYHAENSYPKILTLLPNVDITSIVGRETDLEGLQTVLQRTENTVLVNGMGGLGKTTLLKLLVRQVGKNYEHILWINYAGCDDITNSEHELVQAFAQDVTLLTNLNINIGGDISNYDTLKLINNKLTNIPGPNLLIIDNAPQAFAKVRQFLPGNLNWQILISSRESVSGCDLYELTFLDAPTSLKLFYQYYNLEKRDELINEILNYAGYHTLTIELIAKTANKRRLSIQSLKESLDREGLNISSSTKVTSAHDTTQTPTNYFEYLLRIFSISNLVPTQQFVLRVLSLLPSETIDYRNLKSIFNIGLDDNDFFEILNSLAETGWLIQIEDAYQMHQVLQEVIREKLPPNIAAIKEIIQNLNGLLNIEFDKNPFKVKKFVDYSENLLGFIDASSAEFGDFCNVLGLRNEDLNNLDKALVRYHQSESIFQNLGENHAPDLAGVYNNLQSVYKTLGDIDKAFDYQLKAIAIQEKLPQDDFNLCTSYNNIALLFEIKGELNRAYEYMNKSIVFAEQHIDGDHAYLASAYSSFANILNRMGNEEIALAYQQKAYEMRQRVLDEDHPQLDESRGNLAALYQALGEHDLAEQLTRQSIAYKEKTYGSDSFELGVTYNNLAAIYIEKKDFDTAETFQLKAIQLEENGLGMNHFEVATSYSTLAVIKAGQRKFAEAIKFTQRAITICRLNFPNGHPNIQTYQQFIDVMNIKMPQNNSKIGRNTACSCGSGKKYKHCCGR